MVLASKISAQKVSFFGIVKDAETGELLIGTMIRVNNSITCTSSNSYGFYSINLSPGFYTIEYSYIGYKTVSKNINIFHDTNVDISLTPKNQTIETIEVTTSLNKVSDIQTGKNILSSSQINSIPSIAGESDIFKSIQLLPGVQTANEGSSNLNIRGGSYDQNLILLDEAPVYNPSHALGFFSTFNSAAIRNVILYKGYFSPKFGDRLASVIDITMKEGNNQKTTLNGALGLIASRLTIEGPIIKNNASFIISGRYSYAGETVNNSIRLGKALNFKPFNNLSDKNEINFYDFNAKFNFTINHYNHIYFSTYTGRDHFYYFDLDNASSMDWGNTTGTIRWNHLFNAKLFSNLTMLYSNYDYAFYLKDEAQHYKWSSNIKEASLKHDFEYYGNLKNHISFGYSIDRHIFNPGKIEPRDSSSVIKPFKLDCKNTLNASLYLNNEQMLTNNITVSYGLRYNIFFNIGPGVVYNYNATMESITDSSVYKNLAIIQVYHEVEPRLSSSYQINQYNSIKLSYSHNIQNLHLISNSSVGLPTDIWLPPDKYIKPESANQFTIGYYHNYSQKNIQLTLEGYYKITNKVIDYIDNANLFLNPHIEAQVRSGKSCAYGIEAMIEKSNGKLTGWLGYTLSKISMQINEINNNIAYPARYDIRHNLTINANYLLTKRWSFATVFRLTSGGFITIPKGTFYYEGALFNYYSQRNSYAMPIYHRLDISMTYRSPNNISHKWNGEWVFGVYNVYARKNMFSLFVRQNPAMLGENTAYKMYLFTIVPSVTYNFKF